MTLGCKMKVDQGNRLLLLLSSLIFLAGIIEGLSYDYSASIECLAEPLKPQYEGGIIVNPEFNNGLRRWSKFGKGKIALKKSKEGNSFIVAHSRKTPHDSFSQKIQIQQGNLYTFSAWIRVSKGREPVHAFIKTRRGYEDLGAVVAESGCWSMLKTGLTASSTGPAKIYFQSKNTSVDIWVDSVSVQPFTKEQWRAHQHESTENAHKRKVRIYALDSQGKTIAGAKVSIKQIKPGFPFGSAINKKIIDNPTYQNWFTSRFTVTTFENEMKWASTENIQGKEDYSVPDAMLALVKQHGISVRGHNIFWDDPRYLPWWVYSLSPEQLRVAVERRVNSVVSKYAGQVIAWDVVNENLHFSYFEDKLGKNFSAIMLQKTHQLDSQALKFFNDYNTIEEKSDWKSSPSMYLQKIKESYPYYGDSVQRAIGLEGHFKVPNIAYMRSAIDTLAATGLPIWITELDVESCPNQAQYLEEILMEVRSHPAVRGIVLWTAWYPNGQCYRMCLTDKNFNNLPTGDVVDKLIKEWRQESLMGETNDNGVFESLLHHGDYDLTITHPDTNSTSTQRVNVAAMSSLLETTFHF